MIVDMHATESEFFMDEPQTIAERFRITDDSIVIEMEVGQAVERVLRAWERLSGSTRLRLRAKNRSRSLTRARWTVALALRSIGLSLPQIGEAILRDHTTVMHGLRTCGEVEKENAKILLHEAGL